MVRIPNPALPAVLTAVNTFLVLAMGSVRPSPPVPSLMLMKSPLPYLLCSRVMNLPCLYGQVLSQLFWQAATQRSAGGYPLVALASSSLSAARLFCPLSQLQDEFWASWLLQKSGQWLKTMLNSLPFYWFFVKNELIAFRVRLNSALLVEFQLQYCALVSTKARFAFRAKEKPCIAVRSLPWSIAPRTKDFYNRENSVLFPISLGPRLTKRGHLQEYQDILSIIFSRFLPLFPAKCLAKPPFSTIPFTLQKLFPSFLLISSLLSLSRERKAPEKGSQIVSLSMSVLAVMMILKGRASYVQAKDTEASSMISGVVVPAGTILQVNSETGDALSISTSHLCTYCLKLVPSIVIGCELH